MTENPAQRIACVLLLDVSRSMEGQQIAELNAGLQTYKDALLNDTLAAKRVEVAIVTFGRQVQTVCDFTTAEGFRVPALTAGGETPMGAAIIQGIDLLKRRNQLYKANAVRYTRAWLFLITVGAPTDEWHAAAAQIQQGEQAKNFLFYAVGLEGASFDVLRQISTRSEPLKLKGLAFRELFRWLSTSQAAASRAKPGENVPLANPTGPHGWGEAPDSLGGRRATTITAKQNAIPDISQAIELEGGRHVETVLPKVESERLKSGTAVGGMIIKARCSRSRNFFAMKFRQAASGSWELWQAYPISDELGMKRGFGKYSISGNVYVNPDYTGCPYCGNKTFFLCLGCHSINCQGSGTLKNGNVYVNCANCGNVNYLQGAIETLDGVWDI